MRRKTRDLGRLKLIAFFIFVAVLLPKFLHARSTDELGAFAAGETGIKLCAVIEGGQEDELRFSVTNDQGFSSDLIVEKDSCKTISTAAANYTIHQYLPQEYVLDSITGGTVSEDGASFVATSGGQYSVVYKNTYSAKGYLHNSGYTSAANAATAAEVKFKANGGKGSMQAQSYGLNAQAALSANSFTRGGYTFAGWNTKSDGTGTSYTDGQQIAFSAGGELELYAQWSYVERVANTVIAEQANDPFHVDFTRPAVISDDIATANGNGISTYIETTPDNTVSQVYYYRGVVDNNNVIFAGFCWKIIRTTAYGGTKMIYNGVPSVHDGIQYCDATGEDSSIGKSTMNSSSSSPTDAWYAYGERYASTDEDEIQEPGIVYARDISWNGRYYTLQNTRTVTDWSDDYEAIAHHYRYTCGSTSTICSSVKYMVQISKYTYIYDNFSITLTNGDTRETALAKMLTNENDSKAKKMIDDWYAVNMAGHVSATDDNMAEGKIDYSDKLEQIVFCNDREFATGPLGPLANDDDFANAYESGASYIYSGYAGFKRNRTPVEDSLTASGRNYTPSLDCTNAERDLFSTASAEYGNKALKYPVGMITTDETNMASFDGGKSNSIGGMNYDSFLNSGGQHLLVATPGLFFTTAGSSCSLGTCTGMAGRTMTAGLVRPVISLKELTMFHGGDGTVENPYIVE